MTFQPRINALGSTLDLRQTAVVWRDGQARLEQRDLSAPDGDQILVRIEAAAICRTDLAAVRGEITLPEGRVLGHEAAAVVMAAGPDSTFTEGTRVAINPLMSCQTCRACRDGDRHLCFKPGFLGIDGDGCFADQVLLPQAHIVAIPAALDPLRRAYFEPLAAALGVLSADFQTSSRILLVGRNRIIGLTMRILQRFGFRHLETCAGEDVANLPANRFDFAVESDLNAPVLSEIIRVLRPGGCLVLKSRHLAPLHVDVAALVAKSITLKACRYGSFTRAAELVADPRFSLEALLGPAYSLARFEEAFARASGGEKRKVFLDQTLPE